MAAVLAVSTILLQAHDVSMPAMHSVEVTLSVRSCQFQAMIISEYLTCVVKPTK